MRETLHWLAPMFLTITAPAAVRAQPAADVLADIEWSVESYRLDNGLGVVLSPDHTLPHVALNLWYRVGPADEQPGKTGLAHLFEHLMFGSTPRAGTMGQRLEQMGATNVNGNTGCDYTSYFETFPSDRLGQVLWLERERMAALGDAITERQLRQQIEIVKHERRELHTASPYARSDLALWQLLFPPGHAYHAGILGSSSDVASITLNDARAFFAAHYGASNATLALVGDFEPGQAKALIERTFGSLPQRAARASEPATPSAGRAALGRQLEVIEPGQPERVLLGWQTPAAYSEEDVALALALGVLCSGKASRLQAYLIARSELATRVEATLDSNRLGSVASIGAVAREGAELRTLQFGIEREIELLALDGPFDQELERAKRMILVRALDDIQRLNGPSGASGRSGLLQRFQLHAGRADYLSTWVSRLQQVSADDVRRATRAYLPVASATIVLSRAQAPGPAAAAASAEVMP